MRDIDEMDMLGFLEVRAWSAGPAGQVRRMARYISTMFCNWNLYCLPPLNVL